MFKVRGSKDKVAETVRRFDRFVLSAHERPDGDSLGSEVALRAILRALGKKAVIVNSDPVPDRYSFLFESDPPISLESIREGHEPGGEVFLALDTTGVERLGDTGVLLESGMCVVNIDHHVSNTGFGDVVWVDPCAGSVGEMLCALVREDGWPLPKEAAAALYTAIVTDTGRFSQSNTTPGSLGAAAELLEAGVDPEEMNRLLYASRSMKGLLLEARAIPTLRLDADGRIASIALSYDDFVAEGAVPADAWEFVNIAKGISGTMIAFFFYEVENGRKTRVSIRTDKHVDADQLAETFGGGGHTRAAGCVLEGPVEVVRDRVCAEGERLLEQVTGGRSDKSGRQDV